MIIIMKILLVGIIIHLSISVYFLIRNECVYKFRIKVLDECNREIYLRMPNYYEMVFKYFYEWNFNKFISK